MRMIKGNRMSEVFNEMLALNEHAHFNFLDGEYVFKYGDDMCICFSLKSNKDIVFEIQRNTYYSGSGFVYRFCVAWNFECIQDSNYYERPISDIEAMGSFRGISKYFGDKVDFRSAWADFMVGVNKQTNYVIENLCKLM